MPRRCDTPLSELIDELELDDEELVDAELDAVEIDEELELGGTGFDTAELDPLAELERASAAETPSCLNCPSSFWILASTSARNNS